MCTILITKIAAKIDINDAKNSKSTLMIQNNVNVGVIFTRTIHIGQKTAGAETTKTNIITKQSLLIKTSNNQIKPIRASSS